MHTTSSHSHLCTYYTYVQLNLDPGKAWVINAHHDLLIPSSQISVLVCPPSKGTVHDPLIRPPHSSKAWGNLQCWQSLI